MNANSITIPLLLISLIMAGCSRSDHAEAVSELFHGDYAFKVDDYFRAAAAGDAEAIQWFLTAGMTADVDDGAGNRALSAAAKAGSAASVKVLLANGADPNFTEKHNRSALIFAAGSKDADSVQLLLAAGADPALKDTTGWTPITYAAHRGNERAVEMLAPVSKPYLDEALLIAALSGHPGIIDVLLTNRANIHVRGNNDYTPLMAAAKGGHESAVQLLLDREADRFALNSDGLTAAQIAKQHGHDIIATLLAGLPTRSEISGETIDPLAIRDETGKIIGQSATRHTINGAKITDATPSQLKMDNYREHRMPVILLGVDESNTRAELKLLYSSHGKVATSVGEEIPGSGLRVTQVNHRMTQGKEGLQDASEMQLEEIATGKKHRVTTGENARTIGTYALLEIHEGEPLYEARRGDEFIMHTGQGDSDEIRCRILDVRPDQVLVENTDTGEVHTLPRAR
jgi:ankyrin repeat protein